LRIGSCGRGENAEGADTFQQSMTAFQTWSKTSSMAYTATAPGKW